MDETDYSLGTLSDFVEKYSKSNEYVRSRIDNASWHLKRTLSASEKERARKELEYSRILMESAECFLAMQGILIDEVSEDHPLRTDVVETSKAIGQRFTWLITHGEHVKKVQEDLVSKGKKFADSYPCLSSMLTLDILSEPIE